MFLQFLTVAECRFQTFHHVLLTCTQFIWFLPVDRREICIQQWIFLTVRKCDRAFFQIDPMEQTAVFHVEFLMTADELALPV